MCQGSPDENCRWRQIYLCAVGQDTPLEEGEQQRSESGSSPSSTSTTSTSSTTSTTVEPYRPPTVLGSSAGRCRLRDQSTQRRVYGQLLAGFPVIENNFESRGTFTFGLIPIDFADAQGDAGVESRVREQMRLVTDWYDMVSEGRVKIEWRVHSGWVRVAGSTNQYAMSRSRSDNNDLANAAFAAADPVFDFSGVRAAVFVLPAGQTFMAEGVQGFKHSEFGSAGGYLTAEARIFNYMIAGAYFDRPYKNYWSYWAHETGHMFPLPDLYDQNSQWWIGKQLEDSRRTVLGIRHDGQSRRTEPHAERVAAIRHGMVRRRTGLLSPVV